MSKYQLIALGSEFGVTMLIATIFSVTSLLFLFISWVKHPKTPKSTKSQAQIDEEYEARLRWDSAITGANQYLRELKTKTGRIIHGG